MILIGLIAGLLLAGCGKSELLRTKGHILKGGKVFVPAEGELLQITFVPILPNGQPSRDHYYADVDQGTGIFMPAGKDRRGMPPGFYRVAVELMKKKKDQLGGRFDAEQSPYIFEVDQTTDLIEIDLDNPPVD